MAELTQDERIAQNDGSLPTILMIVGSLRKQSFNKQLAEYAASTLKGRANVQILDWSKVPIFNQDEEFPTPAPVAAVREAVKNANGIWIFTPEYNHGVPGPLANLLDWLSRPLEDGAPAVIYGKNVTVSGAGGMNCVRDAFATIIPTLNFLKMIIAPASFIGVPLSRDNFASNELTIDDLNKDAIAYQGDALLNNIALNIAVQ